MPKRKSHPEITKLKNAIDALDHTVQAALIAAEAESDESDESLLYALDLFERVDALKAALDGLHKQTTRKLGAQMLRREIKSTPINNVGIFERNYNAGTVKYDGDRLVSVVLARALDERQLSDQGEVEREGQTVARIMAECFGKKPLLTGCRAHNVEPTEFVTGQSGDRYHSVKITRTNTKG